MNYRSRNNAAGDVNDSRDASRLGYKERLHQRRQRNLYRYVLVLLVCILVAFIIIQQFKNHIYTGYTIASSAQRTSTVGATDIRLGGSVLTYSKDGAHCTNKDGETLWNQTYEFQDIKLAKNDKVVAIGAYNGREIFVLDEHQQLGTITTTLPIRNIAVAENGNVTTILADTDATWIRSFKPDGTLLFYGQTHMSNSGYPIAVNMSPNGNLLAISYVYVDAGNMKTSIAFYNLGAVGDNYKDCLVSGFDYPDVVPEVGFLSNSVAYAVGDGRLMLYQGSEQPSILGEYLFDKEIRAVYSGNGNVGLVFASDKSEYRYKLDVYNSSGLRGNYYFNLEYTDLFFEKENIVIYNESECIIQTYDGREKFNGSFQESVKLMIPDSGFYHYVLVGNSTINKIQFN